VDEAVGGQGQAEEVGMGVECVAKPGVEFLAAVVVGGGGNGPDEREDKPGLDEVGKLGERFFA